MKTKEIRELIDYIIKTGLEEVYIKTDEITIKTKKTPSPSTEIHQIESPIDIPVSNIKLPKSNPNQVDISPSQEDENYITLKSPMIGTFYKSENPGSLPFVKEGDSITKGQTICIIEAMKLFNEIESDFSGKIVKILVEDATPVEYDQPLFLINPE